MKVLACQISYDEFYRGNDSANLDTTNFVNLNGFCFGYFNGEGICFENNQDKISIDYLIFTAKNPKGIQVVVGWYKNATVLNTCQKHKKGNFYFALAKDEDSFLIEDKHRDYELNIQSNYEWIEMPKRLKLYIEKNKHRVNYRQTDVNTAINIQFSDLKSGCEMIESTIMNQNYLQALQLTNRAIMLFGTKASLIYYKAWVLYLLLQYQHAVKLLSQIMNIEAYSDIVSYMLGNIFFETEDYERSIKFLSKVKKTNLDMTCYMLAQAYAMKSQVALARGAIERAIQLNPNEEVYQSFKQSLKEWKHE